MKTDWSDEDLRDRFYEGLANRVKDILAFTNREQDTLEKLQKLARDIGTRQEGRDHEKLLAKGKAAPVVPFWRNIAPAHTTPFKRDPDAMDIDAAKVQPQRTKEDFIRAMTGKCFGCGSRDHIKLNGHHQRDICAWCGRTGHLDKVCYDRYMGRPRVQRVAAGNLMEPLAPAVEAQPAVIAANAAPATNDVIKTIMENQVALAARIEELTKLAF